MSKFEHTNSRTVPVVLNGSLKEQELLKGAKEMKPLKDIITHVLQEMVHLERDNT